MITIGKLFHKYLPSLVFGYVVTRHLIDQHASHCMGKMLESDFGFENSESEPIERNCRFDHLSAKHFRFEDSAPEPIQRNVFATPFRPYKGKESDQ